MIAQRIEIRGVVQGVGFRPWVYHLAQEEGVRGQVCNGSTGVTIEAWATPEQMASFCRRLRTETPPGAIIDRLRQSRVSVPERPPPAFTIAVSEHGQERRVSIPPDMATCGQCREEIFAAGDRRHRYPFTNCTHCGPRFTIALDVPYDRPLTTMASFPMCPQCAGEYGAPDDRRFHAQPNACPVCGPRLQRLDGEGRALQDADALLAAADDLRRGRIVAIKGLGGYHLACLATSDVTIGRLRRRKRRDAKPFAVMVQDVEEARRCAYVSDDEAELLAGPEAPIVLVGRRAGALAAAVAPGLDQIGLMLPYTPLHHLLLRAVGTALVMTSANLSDEPIVRGDTEAIERLCGIADGFLVHDREIAARCDDSVARVIDGAPMLLRRSRGYVPRAILLERAVEQPTLAVGAQLKNTFCIAVGETAYLGPHIGDLDDLGSYEVFERAVVRMERFLGVEPRVLVHDLHPDYLSTRYALRRAGDEGEASTVAVQHHHAHLASVIADLEMAEGPLGPVLGLVYDGTGFGGDGTAWGGEILYGDASGYERVATLRPLPLAGNERAIREPWRLALALLDDAFEGTAPIRRLRLFDRVPAQHIEVVRQMVRKRVQSPLAHGAGRYFDAVAALALALPESRYEGHLAMCLEGLAGRWRDPAVSPYDFAIDRGEPGSTWQIDLRPALRGLTLELVAGRPVSLVAARFHATLAAASAEVVRSFFEIRRVSVPVVTSGGCFANALLAEQLRAHLEGVIRPRCHRRVPPGDGGIALGQVAVAAAAGGRVDLRQSTIRKEATPCV